MSVSLVSFLIKLQTKASNFNKKETLARVFPCEFCEICKNAFFYRTPLVAASDYYLCIFDLNFYFEDGVA